MARKLSKASSSKAMSEIETGLKSLTVGLRRLVRGIHTAGNGVGARRRPVSKTLRLQGRYMGLIRNLPPKHKSRVKALRANKGVNEAIRLARQLRG